MQQRQISVLINNNYYFSFFIPNLILSNETKMFESGSGCSHLIALHVQKETLNLSLL